MATAEESKRNGIAITTVTYNDRATLHKVVDSFLSQTQISTNMTWYMVLQNCSDAFCRKIELACRGKIDLVMIRFAQNIGLSKAMRYVIERTKHYTYVLNLEDDWILLPLGEDDLDDSWLLRCLAFLERNTDISTLFLRAYATDKEKWQYGWTRSIPYVNHKHANNFNYQSKMQEDPYTIVSSGMKFSQIPTFLFTFNPCLVRNQDYHKTVYPLEEFDKDQKDPKLAAHWGYCEAMAMEKTRDLKSFWVNQGLFGHYEDWFPEEQAYDLCFPKK